MKKKTTKKLLVCVLTVSMLGTMLTGCGEKKEQAAVTDQTVVEQNVENTDDNIKAAVSGGSVKSDGEESNELAFAFNAAPPTLDIHKTSAVVARQIAYGNIFESLMTLTSDYEPTCELAESYDINDDSTEYIYHLRQGVKFHNGEEMKAADVVASMNRWIESYGNAQTMLGDSRFEEVDDYTVRIDLASTCIYVNELIAGAGQMPAIVPASTLDTVDPDTGYLTEYIGTGPYKFDEWVQDQYIKLTKFDDYVPYGEEGYQDGWAGYKNAYIDTVYCYFATDDASRVAGMQSGEYDAAYSLPIDNYSLFDGKEDISKGIKGWDNFVEFAGVDGIYITSVASDKNQHVVGLNLKELGEKWNKEPLDAAFDLLLEEENAVGMVDFYGTEDHVTTILKRPEMNACTDGLFSGKPHPRVYGAFPRILGKYVREEKVLTLEEAIRKMTGKPAETFGLKERGVIREGAYADLVLFNEHTIADQGTFTDPEQYPSGIETVIVNGVITLENGKETGNRAGRVIKK